MDNEEIVNKIEEAFFRVGYDDHVKDENKITNDHPTIEEIHYYHQKKINQDDIKYIIIEEEIVDLLEINIVHPHPHPPHHF